MTSTVSSAQRFLRAHPCPVCGGSDGDRRGQGKRCAGYLSSDGRFAFCTREELAGGLEPQQTDPPSWCHFLEGDCRCGVQHGPSRNGSSTIEATYDYRDESGSLLYQVLRFHPKSFRQRRPDGNGGWIWNLQGVQRVPFRLPDLLAALPCPNGVLICEGEKDVLAAERKGLVATCNSSGAGKWDPSFNHWFQDLDVLIVAHRDPPGHAHALHIHEQLQGIAATVQVAQSSLDEDGADLSDHFAAGLTLSDLQDLPVELLERSEAVGEQDLLLETLAQEMQPEPDEETRKAPHLHFLSGSDFIDQKLSDITPLIGHEDEALLLPGSLAIVAGVGGVGKTTMVIHALAHWAAGLDWFGIKTSRPIRFAIIENEGPHDPFVKKVRVFAQRFHDCPCGGELHGDGGEALRENCFFLDQPWGKFTFADNNFSEELRGFVVGNNIDIVVANPLTRLGMKGAGTPEETLNFLELLFKAGLNNEFAVLLNHHMSKQTKHMPLIEQLSGAWGPHPDAVITLEQNGERSSKLTFAKARWGQDLQGREMILHWLENNEGPIGYKGETAPKIVTDVEMYERIDSHLVDHPGDYLTNIRKAVKGNAKRISDSLSRGIHDKKYRAEPGSNGRSTYYLMTAEERAQALWEE